MGKIVLGEFIGTMIIALFGNGTGAANTLNKNFAKNSSWVFIVFGWGFALFIGAIVTSPLSKAHLNPAVRLGFLLQGTLTIPQFFVYVNAQLAGAIVGSWLVYQLSYNHFTASITHGNFGGIFFTTTSISSKFHNLLSEIVGTFVLVLFILQLAHKPTINALFVPFLIVSIGIALGSLTGHAINPAYDLGPRLMYAFTRLNKIYKDSNWSYAWIPITRPFIGAILTSIVYTIILNILSL